MSYINIIVLMVVFLLTGCAQTDPVRETPVTEKKQEDKTTAAEIQLYRDALLNLDAGNLVQAEQSLKKFSRKRPQLAGPLANLGLIYLKQNKLQAAQESLDKAYQLNPRMPQVNNLLGVIANRRGNIKQAEKFYLSAIQYKPDYVLAHYNLALLYDVYLQDINKAITHYKAYLQLTGNKDQKTRDWLAQLERSVK